MEIKKEELSIREKFKDNRSFIQSVVELLDNANGREKVYRFIQYYTFLLLPLVKNKEKYSKIATILDSMNALMSLCRRVKLYN